MASPPPPPPPCMRVQQPTSDSLILCKCLCVCRNTRGAVHTSYTRSSCRYSFSGTFFSVPFAVSVNPRSESRARIFKLLKSPRIDSASLCSLAGRHDNRIPTRFKNSSTDPAPILEVHLDKWHKIWLFLERTHISDPEQVSKASCSYLEEFYDFYINFTGACLC